MAEFYNSIAIPSNRANAAVWRRNQNTVKFRIGRGLGPISHTVLVALMLAVLGLIYLTQITRTSTYGYQINTLNNKQQALQTQNRDLQVETARLQALERVKQSSVAASMNAPVQTDLANTN